MGSISLSPYCQVYLCISLPSLGSNLLLELGLLVLQAFSGIQLPKLHAKLNTQLLYPNVFTRTFILKLVSVTWIAPRMILTDTVFHVYSLHFFLCLLLSSFSSLWCLWTLSCFSYYLWFSKFLFSFFLIDLGLGLNYRWFKYSDFTIAKICPLFLNH